MFKPVQVDHSFLFPLEFGSEYARKHAEQKASCDRCFQHQHLPTLLDTPKLVASHVQTKRFFATIEVVTQISMACMQAVDLVRDRQAIDLTDDLGSASKVWA